LNISCQPMIRSQAGPVLCDIENDEPTKDKENIDADLTPGEHIEYARVATFGERC